MILNEIALWLGLAYSQEPPLLLSGIVYLHPINNVRMRGSDKSNLAMFKAMCGQTSLSCVVLATTMWNSVGEEVALRRQHELGSNHWKSMVDAGSQIVRHSNSRASALHIIDLIMEKQQRVKLAIQQQMINESRSVEDTTAGQELRGKILDARQKSESRLRGTMTELQEALDRNDEDGASEALKEQAKYEAQIKAKDVELENLKANMASLSERKLEELRNERLEYAERRKLNEAAFDALQQSLLDMHERRKDFDESGPPPTYNETQQAVLQEDQILQMKDFQTSLQIAVLQGQHRLEQQLLLEREHLWRAQQASHSPQNNPNQMFQQFQDFQRDMVNGQRWERSHETARKAAKYGAMGAAAGGAALLCVVM